MALKKDITLTGRLGEDVVVKDAYIRVDFVRADKLTALAKVGVYGSEMQRYETLSFPFTPNVSDGSGNHIAQAYQHLKTLPEFSGSMDV